MPRGEQPSSGAPIERNAFGAKCEIVIAQGRAHASLRSRPLEYWLTASVGLRGPALPRRRRALVFLLLFRVLDHGAPDSMATSGIKWQYPGKRLAAHGQRRGSGWAASFDLRAAAWHQIRNILALSPPGGVTADNRIRGGRRRADAAFA